MGKRKTLTQGNKAYVRRVQKRIDKRIKSDNKKIKVLKKEVKQLKSTRRRTDSLIKKSEFV